MSIESRLAALEREAAKKPAARDFTWAQIVHASLGEDPGLPQRTLKPGEETYAAKMARLGLTEGESGAR